MSDNQRDILNAVFSLLVILLAAMVTQRFFLPLVWAGILCIATWPLFTRLVAALGQRQLAGALVMTLATALVFVVPVLIAMTQMMHQAPVLANYLAEANNNGVPTPQWLSHIPFAGAAANDWWEATLTQPHGLSHLAEDGSLGRLHSASEVLKSFGASLMHRMVDFGLALLCLFFFYKDGPSLVRQLTAMGSHFLGDARWDRYATKVPTAIRATVNGLVLVGLAEGFVLGIGYGIAGVPSPALWAAGTGILAIIPFGAPLAFFSVAGVLLVNGSVGAAIAVAVLGMVVLFVADHFVRPAIIGSATKLPFLAVLFGILGGVETLGLVGLFIGPVVMTLFMTLWYEEKQFERAAPATPPL
ncbi:MAG: AI-2E family transporter [Pseudomonadota bacterium]